MAEGENVTRDFLFARVAVYLMPEDVELRQEILQRTLDEVTAEEATEHREASPCVICLDAIAEPAFAVPCSHANFDFLCLLSWLEQRPSCPLCKSDVTAVKYNLDAPDGPKLYQLPPPAPPQTSTTTPTTAAHPHHRRPFDFRRGRRPPRELQRPRPPEPDDPLLRRRHVYRHQLYSLRVGSNRISQYRELTPELFNRDEQLVSRARKWIRRELRVFSFLNPATEDEEDGEQGGPGHSRMPRAGQPRLESRRGNNAEFLLEYVIAILRTVDVKGSAGQAEELLRDFLGRENARLFLHELQSWLRSPYMSLEDWDRNVQYEDTTVRPGPVQRGPRGPRGLESDRRSTPVYGRDNRSIRGRVSKPYARSPRPYGEGSSRDAVSQARRLQHARDRYIPD